MFTATHKATGQEIKGIPGDGAEDHLMVTSYWCAARQIASLVDFLVGSSAAVSADSADYQVTRESS